MRLIDADALIAGMEADAEQMEEPIAKMFTYGAISDIRHAPTAVDLVRCRECKHLANRDETGGKCWRRSGFARVVKNNDYCSYGERKENHD